MKLFGIASIALLFAIQSTAPEPAVVDGIVVREGTGQPVQGATVSLALETASPRTATSGEDGRFRIANLTPGRYTINVTRTGFARARQAKGPMNVTLAPGQTLEGVRLQLAPTAVITRV